MGMHENSPGYKTDRLIFNKDFNYCYLDNLAVRTKVFK